MNHMAEVAKLLGIEPGEFFEVHGCDGIYFLACDGLYNNNSGFAAGDVLIKLLSGECHIKRKPYKPNEYEIYWCIDAFGSILDHKWEKRWMDIMYYKLGNCYRTKEEAEANRDKWLAFYSSDEVLEV